jgi:hypothetical protein
VRFARQLSLSHRAFHGAKAPDRCGYGARLLTDASSVPIHGKVVVVPRRGRCLCAVVHRCLPSEPEGWANGILRRPPTRRLTATPAGAPKDLAAAPAAAQLKVDRHASGDFAGEWLLFTKDLRDNITQQAFVEFSQKCSATGLVMKSAGGRMDSPERAVIHFDTMGVTHAVTMIYEYGGWFKEPDEFLQANFGKTGDELIAVDQAAGHCDTQ